MTDLLDVNVMVALVDPGHVFHDVAHRWFGSRTDPWATCPITENGTVRIISHPRYPNSTGTAGAAIEIVRGLCALHGHVFWADALSITSPHAFRPEVMAASSQVTDSYLLALAVANGGRLVTFDKRLVTTAVPNGGDAVLTLGP